MAKTVAKNGSTDSSHEVSRGGIYQILAVLFCVGFGAAMVVNTQLSGEGVWFWYTNAFRNGAKLYSDLHLAMQPLYILESLAWMKLFGIRCIVTEIPSLLHVLIYAVGIFLVLRESDWPDWQKAIVLASAFVLSVAGHNYRLDDYHVVAECLILYSLVMLLMLARTDGGPRQLALSAVLGLLSGLTITSRVTDGVALLVASGMCMVLLARRRKLILVGLFAVVAALTVILIVKLTGDTFSDYVSSTVIKAAGSKGGTGSIFAAPFLLLRNALQLLRTGRKWLFLFMVALVALGALVQRRWKLRIGQIFLLQLAIAVAVFGLSSHSLHEELLTGLLIAEVVLCSVVLTCLLNVIVATRLAQSFVERRWDGWDARETLVLLPLCIWASNSAGAAGEPLTQYYAPVAMLMLLGPVLQPFRRQASWVNASFLVIMTLVGLSAVTSKVLNPYSWNDVRTYPMFVNRVWFDHPVYGPMYIDRDDLKFNQSICNAVGAAGSGQELLSLPYPYPNYFCAIPPWHGYIQTYFDTSKRATIEQLMNELKTAPPRWIVYQRQLHIMSGAERLYNHGQPLAQRDLDKMLMENIGNGRWQLIGKRDYPQVLDKDEYVPGDGWYVVRTWP
jgi:hypothetical protein